MRPEPPVDLRVPHKIARLSLSIPSVLHARAPASGWRAEVAKARTVMPSMPPRPPAIPPPIPTGPTTPLRTRPLRMTRVELYRHLSAALAGAPDDGHVFVRVAGKEVETIRLTAEDLAELTLDALLGEKLQKMITAGFDAAAAKILMKKL
jgi:hypothetical protein